MSTSAPIALTLLSPARPVKQPASSLPIPPASTPQQPPPETPETPAPETPVTAERRAPRREESATPEAATDVSPGSASTAEANARTIVLHLALTDESAYTRGTTGWVQRTGGVVGSRPVEGGDDDSTAGVEVLLQHPSNASAPKDVAPFCFPPTVQPNHPALHGFSFTDSAGTRTFGLAMSFVRERGGGEGGGDEGGADGEWGGRCRSADGAGGSCALEALVVLCAWPALSLLSDFLRSAHTLVQVVPAALARVAATFCASVEAMAHGLDFLWHHPCWCDLARSGGGVGCQLIPIW